MRPVRSVKPTRWLVLAMTTLLCLPWPCIRKLILAPRNRMATLGRAAAPCRSSDLHNQS